VRQQHCKWHTAAVNRMITGDWKPTQTSMPYAGLEPVPPIYARRHSEWLCVTTTQASPIISWAQIQKTVYKIKNVHLFYVALCTPVKSRIMHLSDHSGFESYCLKSAIFVCLFVCSFVRYCLPCIHSFHFFHQSIKYSSHILTTVCLPPFPFITEMLLLR